MQNQPHVQHSCHGVIDVTELRGEEQSENLLTRQISILRSSRAFDSDWYLENNPDVRVAAVDAAEHYVRWGAGEGRVPARDFDCIWYSYNFKDARSSGLLPFVHYALVGYSENRSINAHLDRLGAAELRFHDYPPTQLPQRFRRTSRRGGARIAVVAHVFYVDTWDEISSAIGNVSEPASIYISLVSGYSDVLLERIWSLYPEANIDIYAENRGRDILPFLHLVNEGVLFRHELICKIHSKRSNYVADGDEWRRALIAGVLGDRDLVGRIVKSFREELDIGVIVAEGNIYQGLDRWLGNESYLDVLSRKSGLAVDYSSSRFPGGNIFWIRPIILAALRTINLHVDDLEPEPLPNNGTLAHSVERLIGCICENFGLRMLSSSCLGR